MLIVNCPQTTKHYFQSKVSVLIESELLTVEYCNLLQLRLFNQVANFYQQ